MILQDESKRMEAWSRFDVFSFCWSSRAKSILPDRTQLISGSGFDEKVRERSPTSSIGGRNVGNLNHDRVDQFRSRRLWVPCRGLYVLQGLSSGSQRNNIWRWSSGSRSSRWRSLCNRKIDKKEKFRVRTIAQRNPDNLCKVKSCDNVK